MATERLNPVRDQLGRRIAAGQLAEGEVVTLAALQEEYGVSMPVIREATKALEAIGMVRSRPRVGVTVRSRASWDAFNSLIIRWNLEGPGRQEQLETLMELRVAVEPTAAKLAALRAAQATAHRLVGFAATIKELGERHLGRSEAYLEADIAFHSLLLDASDNPLFRQLAGPICDTLRGRHQLGLTLDTPPASILDGHLHVANSVLCRDAEAAERCASGYIATIWDEVTAVAPVRS